MELVLLTVVITLTGFNLAVHWYTQLVTYALFPTIAAAASGTAFVAYHRQYEKGLPLAIYLPWALLTAASAALVFVRPDGFPLWTAIVILVLNASIAPISILFAAPVHRRIDADDELDNMSSRALLRWNAVRLVIMTASLALILTTAGALLVP